jgi:hypothetical protein
MKASACLSLNMEAYLRFGIVWIYPEILCYSCSMYISLMKRRCISMIGMVFCGSEFDCAQLDAFVKHKSKTQQ